MTILTAVDEDNGEERELLSDRIRNALTDEIGAVLRPAPRSTNSSSPTASAPHARRFVRHCASSRSAASWRYARVAVLSLPA